MKKRDPIYPKDYINHYDTYYDPLSIRYTKGCMRRLFESESIDSTPSPLGYGYVVAADDDMPLVREACLAYAKCALTNVMENVYECDDARLQKVKTYDSWNVKSTMDRFYPSNPDWIKDENGSPSNNGRYLHPRRQNPIYECMVHGGECVRRAFFDIDKDKKTYSFPTEITLKAANMLDTARKAIKGEL